MAVQLLFVPEGQFLPRVTIVAENRSFVYIVQVKLFLPNVNYSIRCIITVTH